MKAVFAALAAAVALAACSPNNASPPRYVVVKQAATLEASGAAKTAEQICGRHGLGAKLEIADLSTEAAPEFVFRCHDED